MCSPRRHSLCSRAAVEAGVSPRRGRRPGCRGEPPGRRRWLAQQRPVRLAKGFRDVHDLTHVFSPRTPVFPAFKPIQIRPKFSIAKDGFFANEVTFDEHTGTHLDAPAHFVANGVTADKLPADKFFAPLAVISIADRAAKNADALLSVDDVLAWEKQHGRLPAGAFVAMHSGWDAKVATADRFLNKDAKGTMHAPGFSEEVGAFPGQGTRHRRRGRGHAEPRRGVRVEVRGPSRAARRGQVRRRTAGEPRHRPALGRDDHRRRAETRGCDGRPRPRLRRGLRRRTDMTTASRSVAATVLFAGVVFGQARRRGRRRRPLTPSPTPSTPRWKKDLSNWGRWGKDDEIGALNLITPAKRKQAAALVKDGVSVSLSARCGHRAGRGQSDSLRSRHAGHRVRSHRGQLPRHRAHAPRLARAHQRERRLLQRVHAGSGRCPRRTAIRRTRFTT